MVVLIPNLPKTVLSQILKCTRARRSALKQQLLVANHQSQVGLERRFGAGGAGLKIEMGEPAFPAFDFLDATPFGQALLNGPQIGHRQHEFWNGNALLQGCIGDVKPEFVFGFREGRPDMKRLPAVASERQAELFAARTKGGGWRPR